MTVFDMMHLTQEEFEVVVKEPEQCFKYKCSSKNTTNRDDFVGRHIYNITTTGGKMNVYCW